MRIASHERTSSSASRRLVGVDSIRQASGHPHADGRFPHSKDVIEDLFRGVDIRRRERDMILGLNGARLFCLKGQAAA